MRKLNVDGLLLTTEPEVRYFSGFHIAAIFCPSNFLLPNPSSLKMDALPVDVGADYEFIDDEDHGVGDRNGTKVEVADGSEVMPDVRTKAIYGKCVITRQQKPHIPSHDGDGAHHVHPLPLPVDYQIHEPTSSPLSSSNHSSLKMDEAVPVDVGDDHEIINDDDYEAIGMEIGDDAHDIHPLPLPVDYQFHERMGPLPRAAKPQALLDAYVQRTLNPNLHQLQLNHM